MPTSNRGYFGIGIYQAKTLDNIGTLWRSAYQLGASFIFVIGHRYRHMASDTCKTWRHIPLYEYDTYEAFSKTGIPNDCRLIGVEMGGAALPSFTHPERCVYLLGAEDTGLPLDIQNKCHTIVSIPSIRINSYNVAVAGSLLMYDRQYKNE